MIVVAVAETATQVPSDNLGTLRRPRADTRGTNCDVEMVIVVAVAIRFRTFNAFSLNRRRSQKTTHQPALSVHRNRSTVTDPQIDRMAPQR